MSRPQTQSRPLRKDAQENRRLLIETAKQVFARDGFSATLHDIAREAGVGVGTVYRRFTNKQELMAEIYEEQIGELEKVLHTALAMDDAWAGLVFYLEESVRIQVRDRGMAQIFSGHRMGKATFDRAKDRIAPLVDRVVERGIEAGVVREDAAGTDLIFAQVGILSIAAITQPALSAQENGAKSEIYRRYLWLTLQALHRQHPSNLPLPVAALTTEETHRIFAQENSC